ncbi:MAG: hypothetical protein P4L51_00710 [Puia sp.]|nr:hypothetical protein [Puia sp.]
METIMEPSSIRQKLHQYVDKGDDKLLKLMYAVAREYNEDDDFEYQFTDEEIKIFEQRTAKRESGESKTYNWKEAKEIITRQKKME